MRNQGFQPTPITPLFQFPVSALDRALAKHGFQPVTDREIRPFHALADELIAGEIAGPAILRRVQNWSGRALHWRPDEGVDGAILASIPLTRSGVESLLSGRFGFANARREWVCSPSQRTVGLLSWGMAGRSPTAQTAALRGLLTAWHGFYREVRVYARARTSAGAGLLTRLQFKPLPGSPDSSPLYASHGFPMNLDRFLARRARPTPMEVLS